MNLTLAGTSVALLRRSPGQVVVEVSAALTVHTCCVVLALTLRVHLQRNTDVYREGQSNVRRFTQTTGWNTNTSINNSMPGDHRERIQVDTKHDERIQ